MDIEKNLKIIPLEAGDLPVEKRSIRPLVFFALFFLATCGNLFAQTWPKVGPSCFTSGAAYTQSLTGCNGTPSVAFYDAGASNPGLSVMTYNGSRRVYLVPPGFGNMTTVTRNSSTQTPL